MVNLAMFLSLFFALQTTPIQTEPEETWLKNRVLLSDWIVVGEVVRIEKATGFPEMITEHSPDWHWATVKIKSPLMDHILRAPEEVNSLLAIVTDVNLNFLFANSRDVTWFGCPKFQIGQKGIFILSLRELNNFNDPDGDAKYLVAISTADYQPEEKLEKIKGLIDETNVR